MPSKNITFDPDAGVPKGANFTLHTGADFHANFNVVNTANSAFNFTGYSGSAQMSKSVKHWGDTWSNHKFYCWVYKCI